MRTGRMVALAGAVVLAITLTGCSDGPTATPSSLTPRPTSTTAPTPTPTATVFLGTGVSLLYSCDELVQPATIRAVDKNLTVDKNYTPDTSTSAERAVAIGGSACKWTDSRTGTSLIVAAAHPDPPTLANITASTQNYATKTTAFGNDVTGYIVNNQAEIFTANGYWATASSPLFSELKNARVIMAALADSLPE